MQRGLADLRAFLEFARASGARVVAFQFADRQEASTGALQPGNRWIALTLQQDGVPSLQAGPIFRACGPIASQPLHRRHPPLHRRWIFYLPYGCVYGHKGSSVWC